MQATELVCSNKLAREMPPGSRAHREEQSYAALVRTPESLGEFLDDCCDGFGLNSLSGEPFSEYLRRRVSIGGRPFSFAALCVATEDASDGWDECGSCGTDLRASMARFSQCNSMQAQGSMDLSKFVQVWPSERAERMSA